MAEPGKRGEELTEEITIDLSRIPLRPTGKSEIQRLEMALIIATLYSPDVLELIRDPVERATWVDSLAVAAAALAREKAGYTISQIADEVGRSEATIRAHLQGKTKAGKLVIQTYEKLKRGELKIVVPFIKVPAEMAAKLQDLEKAKQLVEEELKKCREAREKLEGEMEKYRAELERAREHIRSLEEENRELKAKIEEYRELIKNIAEKLSVVEELIELIKKAKLD